MKGGSIDGSVDSAVLSSPVCFTGWRECCAVITSLFCRVVGVLIALCFQHQSVLQGGGSVDSAVLSSPVQVAGLRGQGVHATVRDHSG